MAQHFPLQCSHWPCNDADMTKLHIDSVVKFFNEKALLTDICIICTQGEIVGMLGRNGSGKSTLLKIIFGAMPAEGRFVKVGDRVLQRMSHNSGLINYLPQDEFLPGHLRTGTVINLFCSKSKASLISGHELFRPLLKMKIADLSGGQNRLLEIWLMVYSEVKFSLLDEPFNGIAPVYKEEIKEIIKLQSRFKGFIITDHDYRNVLELASRMVILQDGICRNVYDEEDLIRWGYLSRG